MKKESEVQTAAETRGKREMKWKSSEQESKKVWLDDSFMCLNLFYTTAPVPSPTTIGRNFPCVDKLHGSLGAEHDAVML